MLVSLSRPNFVIFAFNKFPTHPTSVGQQRRPLGALAVGTERKPSVAVLASPKLPQLESLVQELAALSEQRPAVDARLRRRLVQTASVGGARPKATIQDEAGQYWLVKPGIHSDAADIPCLEHVGQQWGRQAG